MSRHLPTLLVLVIVMLASGGCLRPNFDIETIKKFMPGPSPQLKHLDMLAGKWKTTGQVKMMGLKDQMMTVGTSEAKWICNDRFLVDQSNFDLDQLGPMGGMSVWTWDNRASVYRFWWFDGFGETAQGTATFDQPARTWHIKTVGRNGWCSVISKGTIHQIDNDTLEWTWNQWDGWHIFRIGEMSGTSKRITP